VFVLSVNVLKNTLIRGDVVHTLTSVFVLSVNVLRNTLIRGDVVHAQ
jgi:hypothetical protein